MFLTVCNLILSPHPLGRSILDEARDQPIQGSFLKTLGTRLEDDEPLFLVSVDKLPPVPHPRPQAQARAAPSYGKEKIRGAERNLPDFFGLCPTSPENIVCGTN